MVDALALGTGPWTVGASPGKRMDESKAPRTGKKPAGKLGNVGRAYREAQPYIEATFQFFGSIALLTFAGFWADRHFGTSPWLLLTGCLLGFATGLWAFLKVVLALDRRHRGDEDRKR